jgi:hypothetical protein
VALWSEMLLLPRLNHDLAGQGRGRQLVVAHSRIVNEGGHNHRRLLHVIGLYAVIHVYLKKMSWGTS